MKFFKAFPLLLLVCVVAPAASDENTSNAKSEEINITETVENAKTSTRDTFLDDEGKASYDRIKEYEEKNLAKFSNLVKEKKAQLEAHELGQEVLTEHDIYFTQKSIEGLQKKVDEVAGLTEEEFDKYIFNKVQSFHEVKYIQMDEL